MTKFEVSQETAVISLKICMKEDTSSPKPTISLIKYNFTYFFSYLYEIFSPKQKNEKMIHHSVCFIFYLFKLNFTFITVEGDNTKK